MDKVITISTTIPVSAYYTIKEKGYKYNNLLLRGLATMDGTAEKEQNQRIKELEEGNDRLQRKLSLLFGELEVLRDGLKK